ncbi:hypothetical protein [Algoriphagus chordae]|uniref:Auto-transporter adhesin head GIN domain-containing protein n=1 Tax=Algoriphagus chordae TaxID=237019 RepID=A0A2W7QPL2_9BACT|nr:hypothetical protein [Algoriphagus chordae]PZX49931.1 hypothetical protein LV85_02994 [Algoriphagus chordae]
MKNTFNPSVLFLLVIGSMIFFSCDSMDDAPPVPNLSVIEDDTQVNIAFEDLDNLTLSVLSNAGLSARTSVDLPGGNLCDGALISIDEAEKMIRVDFGDGCTSTGGVTRKGIVMLQYTGNLLLTGAMITTTFDGYEVNGMKVEGARVLTNKGVDISSNTINLEVQIQNGKITWSDDTFVTITSDQLRVIKLGTQGEYEASITGTAEGTSRIGTEYTTSVSEALHYTKSCLESGVTVPTSGILKFLYGGIELTVDYGDGACDKMATINYPTGSKEVTLD